MDMSQVMKIEFRIWDEIHNCNFIPSKVKFSGNKIIATNSDGSACPFAEAEYSLDGFTVQNISFKEDEEVLRIELIQK